MTRPISQLVLALERQGVKLFLSNGRVQFHGPEAALASAEFAEARQRKAEVSDFVNSQAAAVALPLIADPTLTISPLSLTQTAILHAIKQGGGRDRVVTQLRLTGSLNPSTLEGALDDLIRRHAVLRTRFLLDRGEPQQEVGPFGQIRLERTDLAGLPEDGRESHIAAIVGEAWQAEMAPERGLVLQAWLVRFAEEEYLLILAGHALALDEQSMAVLCFELPQFYLARLTDRPAELPPLAARYVDFVHWERRVFAAAGAEHAMTYWEKRLLGSVAAELPGTGFEGQSPVRRAPLDLSQDLGVRLQAYARQATAPVGVILLGAIVAALGLWADRTNMVVGLAVTGRPTGAERLVGPFVRIRPFFLDLSVISSFAELVHAATQAYRDAADVLRPTTPALSEHYHLRRVLLVNTRSPPPIAGPLGLPLRFTAAEYGEPTQRPWQDLGVFLSESPLGLKGEFRYQEGRFSEATMHGLVASALELVDRGLKEPSGSIGA